MKLIIIVVNNENNEKLKIIIMRIIDSEFNRDVSDAPQIVCRRFGYSPVV
jgi:hypothetical protein